MATIATDPRISRLGFDDVLEVFRKAQEGQLEDPPEDWLRQGIWSIPNNVPTEHEHAVTDLVGRDRELKRLFDYVRNERIHTIAVTAPGGTGKTALVLEALHEICTRPEFQPIVEYVVFVSMRLEKLTTSGIEHLTASETIVELDELVMSTLRSLANLDTDDRESILHQLSDKKVLICIDNLETLLRDYPEQFTNYNQELPRGWRILVTSRISVDTATATMPLDQLNENAASHLARIYSIRIGPGRINDADLLKLVHACNRNPLAIRLTIDYVNLGKPLPVSVETANQEVLEFSFRNLLDALTDNANCVLECLFLKDNATQQEIGELLEFDQEQTSETIRELLRTSVLSQASNDGKNQYSLASSIREILVGRSDLQLRTELAARISKRQALVMNIDEAQVGLDKLNFFFIPDSCPEALKILLSKAARVLINLKADGESTTDILKELTTHEASYADSAVFHRFLARAKWCVHDQLGWEKHYMRALSLDPQNPTTKSYFAFAYLTINRYDDAINLYQQLWDDDWGDPARWPYARSMIVGFFRTLLHAKRYDQLLQLTENWEDSEGLAETLGGFRAITFKRKVEKLHSVNPRLAVKSLDEAVVTIDKVLDMYGYTKHICNHGGNIIQEVAYYLEKNVLDTSSNQALKWLNFTAKQIKGVTQRWSPVRVVELLERFANIERKENPFKSEEWVRYAESFRLPIHSDSEADGDQFLPVRVSHIPKTKGPGFSKYLWVTDRNGERFFLHFNALADADWGGWCELREGDQMKVIPSKLRPTEGKNRKVDRATLIQ